MRVASAVFCVCMFIMIQMVDRPNTTPIGQDRDSLTFKALLYLNVTVHAQVCRLFCVYAIVQLGSGKTSCGFHQLPVYLKYSVRLKLLAQLVLI